MENGPRLETENGGRGTRPSLPWVEKSGDPILRLDTKLKQGEPDELSLAGRISRHDDPDPARRRRRRRRFAKKIEGRRRRLDGDHGRVGIRGNGRRFYGDCVRKQRCASYSGSDAR